MESGNHSLRVKAFACAMSLALTAGFMPCSAVAEMVEEADVDTVAETIEVLNEESDAPAVQSIEAHNAASATVADDMAQGEAATSSESSDGEVSYFKCSWNGKGVVSEENTASAISVPSNGSMTSGWYSLDSDVTVDGRIRLSGDTDLILCDGCTLDVRGIYVPQGSKLRIYAQSDDENTGRIVSHPSSGAAIGADSNKHPGGEVEIHGGIIEAEGANHCAAIGSNDGDGTTAPVSIYGGSVTATGGGDGAGIGGGRKCNGGDIRIFGGYIYPKGGGENGAGIGGGDGADGGNITINGGIITTSDEPNEDGAGIGGGDGGEGGTITINGGTITTYSRDGAGIGGGDDGEGGKIAINGGKVTCWDMGHAQGARIGGGCDADGGSIAISGGTVDVHMRDGAGIGGGEDADGGEIVISGGVITTHPEGQGNGAGIGGGNRAGAGGSITISGGEVNANARCGAAIGGGRANDDTFDAIHNSGAGGEITISGGNVHACSEFAFGIGAGGQQGDRNFMIDGDPAFSGCAGTIAIGGFASVEAEGRPAAIGGDGGSITVKDGCYVEAKGIGGYITSGYDEYKQNNKSSVNCSTYEAYSSGVMLMDKKARLVIEGGCLKAIGGGRAHGITLQRSRLDMQGGTLIAQSGAQGVGCVSWKGVDYFEGAEFKTGNSEDNLTVLAADKRNSVKDPKYECLRISDSYAPGDPSHVSNGLDPLAQVFGYSLSLDGEIAMNMYLLLGKDVLANPENYQVEIAHGDEHVLARKVSEVTPVKMEYGRMECDAYCFTLATAAKDFDVPFTLRLRDLESDTYVGFADRDGTAVDANKGVDFSVENYLIDKAGSSSGKMGDLARDMLAYCTYAKQYFAVRDNGCAAEALTIQGFEPVGAGELSRFACVAPADIEHFSYKGTTLVLDGKISYRVHFTSDCPDVVRVFCNGSTREVEIKQSGRDSYYFEVSDISARNVDEMYDFQIISNTEETRMTTGPLSYAHWALSQKGDTLQRRSLQRAMMGLYRYNQSAKAYFESEQ